MPDEEIKDVEQVESSTTTEQEEVVNPEESTHSEQATQVEPEVDASTPEVGKPQYEAVDERGVPYKNVAAEERRKREELAERLPEMIREAITPLVEKKEQPQYSVEQLEAFANDPETNPANVAWARKEIRKLEKEENAKVVTSALQKFQEAEKSKQIAAQSFNYVAQTYPDAFLKDANGNPTNQWNNNHPLTQLIGQYMQNPEFKNSPQGLMVAADAAYGRYSKTVSPKQAQKAKQLKQEVRQLQKATLTESGGRGENAVPESVAAIDRLRQTGNIKDAQAAIKAILGDRKR